MRIAIAKQALEWVKKYFGPLPVAEQPAKPDISETRQDTEK